MCSAHTAAQSFLSASFPSRVSSLSTKALPSASRPTYQRHSASFTSASGDTLTVTYKTVGTTGNSFTLAASAATRSGATLSGGEADGNLIASSGAFADGEYGWIKLENAVT